MAISNDPYIAQIMTQYSVYYDDSVWVLHELRTYYLPLLVTKSQSSISQWNEYDWASTLSDNYMSDI